MKHAPAICLVLLSICLAGPWNTVEAMELNAPDEEPETRVTRFPAGMITPMLGLSFLGVGGSVLTGVTGGVGYYVIDRLELFATVSVYFGDQTVLTVDPGLQWIFWETKHFAPYLKVRGGPLFVLSGSGGTGGTVLGGGGFYLFPGKVFGFKIGGLAGYLFGDGFDEGFTWAADLGIVF
jgi:hypothetical protein